jgi:hypothetical protein
LTALCRQRLGSGAASSFWHDQLVMLFEGALVCTQSTGHAGPACNFVEAGRAIVAAHPR